MKHALETKIGIVDRLSKRPDWKVSIEKDNENQKLIKEQCIYSLAEVVIKWPEVDILEKVLQGDKWQIEGDLVLKEEKVYVPKNEGLRVEEKIEQKY